MTNWSSTHSASEQTAVAPLEHLGVLEIKGQGGADLLQGQSSAQIAHADGVSAPLTAFCSVKGRILANAQLVRVDTERLWLLLPTQNIAPLKAHLAKFAPFYKAELRQREDIALLGMIGEEAPALVASLCDIEPPSIWHQASSTLALVVRHPGPLPRLLLAVARDNLEPLWQQLTASAIPVGNAQWRLQDIYAGLAWVDDAHRDVYLPQMLNWEALGGISFKKGCYTGQEIVARAHFRGQVKKRLARLQLEGSDLPAPGDAVLDNAGKRQGEVFAAELNANQRVELLAVLNTRASEEPLNVAGQHGERLPLPYPIERLDPESLFDNS